MLRSAAASAKISGRRFISTANSKTQYTSLSNGLTVATESNPLAKSSTIGLWVGAGSKHETATNNGVSKLVTKALFDGSKQAASKQGVILGSNVERESIALFGTTLGSKASSVVDLLAQSFNNPSFSEEAVANYKKLAIKDTEIIEETPRKTVLEHLHATAFQGTSLALPVNGTPESISNLQASDLESLINKYTVSSNAVVVGAGNIKHEELVELVEKKLKIPAGVVPKVKPAKFLGSELRFRDDTLPSAYISIAVNGPSLKSKDLYTAQVASEVFGAYTSSEPASSRQGSKLADIIHTNHLAQNFHHFTNAYKDAGLWGFYTETSNVGNIDDLIHFSLKQWNRLSTDVTETEVFKAKSVLKSKILTSLGSTSAIANDIGTKVLVNDRRQSIDEIFAKIDQVSVKSINEWAQRDLWDQDIAVSGTGQIEALFDYNRLRNEMALLRW